MRTSTAIENLLDQLILKTESKEDFLQLSEIQREIAAVQILISTSTRHGTKIFFKPQNEYLWHYAQEGLRLINAYRCLEQYSVVIKMIKDNVNDEQALNKLEDQIVIKDFESIYINIRKYLNDNFEELKI